MTTSHLKPMDTISMLVQFIRYAQVVIWPTYQSNILLQLYNFSKRRSFDVDCVVIDEAGQLSLGSAALALRSLTPTGRIIIAGDSEQLAPILTAQYPRLKSRLFGSILDCLMDLSNDSRSAPVTVTQPASPTESSEILSQMSTIVQLTENFRYRSIITFNF